MNSWLKMLVIHRFFNHNIELDHYIPSTLIASNSNGHLSLATADGVLWLCKIFFPGRISVTIFLFRTFQCLSRVGHFLQLRGRGVQVNSRLISGSYIVSPCTVTGKSLGPKQWKFICEFLRNAVQSIYRVLLRNEQLVSTYAVKA